MTTDVMKRMPSWRAFMWVGVVGSVVAWAMVWFLGRGPSVITLLAAMAAAALSIRASQGLRWALTGEMVTGFVLFLASLYWLAALYTSGGPVTVADVFAASVAPLFAATFLMVGSAVGFRHNH